MSPMPRAARAPHSSKVPKHVRTAAAMCSRAAAHARKNWRSCSCGGVPHASARSRPAPQAIRNKTYPLRTVIDALSTYSLGYSLEDTADA